MSIALYLMIVRFIIDIYLRKIMSYFVTDRRIVIDRRGPWMQSKSLDIRRLPVIKLAERPDGSGTIRFGVASGWFGPNNLGVWQPSTDSTPQFLRIPDVRQVYELIRQQADA